MRSAFLCSALFGGLGSGPRAHTAGHLHPTPRWKLNARRIIVDVTVVAAVAVAVAVVVVAAALVAAAVVLAHITA